jgi:hypothetical protein
MIDFKKVKLIEDKTIYEFNKEQLSYTQKSISKLTTLGKITMYIVWGAMALTILWNIRDMRIIKRFIDHVEVNMIKSVEDAQVNTYKVERFKYVEKAILSCEQKIDLYSRINDVETDEDFFAMDSIISLNILSFKYNDDKNRVINKDWVYIMLTEKYQLSPQEARHALKIIQRESSFRENITNVNKNKTIDRGLFQINSTHDDWVTDLRLNLFSAEDNIKAFIYLYERYRWEPWRSSDPDKHIVFKQ